MTNQTYGFFFVLAGCMLILAGFFIQSRPMPKWDIVFRGNNFSNVGNDVSEPRVFGDGNVQFPNDWDEVKCAEWRMEHNVIGRGYDPK